MAAHRNLGAAGAVAQGPGEASGGYTRRGNFFAAPQDWAGHGFDMAPIQQGVGGLSGHPGAAPRASNTDWSAMVGTAGGLLPRQELGPYSGVISATEHWGAGGEFELTETIATNWVTVDALARDRAFTTFLCPPREHTRGPKIAIKTKEFPLTMPSAVPNGGVPPIIGYRSGQRVITMHRIGIALLMNVDEVLMNNYREIFQKFRQIAGSVLQVSRARARARARRSPARGAGLQRRHRGRDPLDAPPLLHRGGAQRPEPDGRGSAPAVGARPRCVRGAYEGARVAEGAPARARARARARAHTPHCAQRELEDIDAAFTRGGFTVPTAVVHYHGMLTQASRVMSESLSTWLVDARTRLPQKAPDGPILASFVNGKVAISSPAIHSDSRGVVQDPMVRWEYLGDFSVTHPDMDEAPGTVNRDIRMWDFDSANDAVTLKFADNVLPNAGVWGATGWLEPQLMARIVRECNETARDDADPGHVLVHFSQRDGRRLRQAVCAVGELDANYFPETLRTAYLRGFVEKFAAAHGGVAARGGPYDPDGRIAADIRTSFAFLSQHPFIRPEAVAAVDGAPVRGGRIVGIAAHEALRRIFPSLPANVPGQPAYNFMPSDQLGAHRVAPPAGAAYADIDILDVLMLSGVPAVRALPLRTKVREATNTWSDASAGAPWLHYVIAFAMAMPIQLANLQVRGRAGATAAPRHGAHARRVSRAPSGACPSPCTCSGRWATRAWETWPSWCPAPRPWPSSSRTRTSWRPRTRCRRTRSTTTPCRARR